MDNFTKKMLKIIAVYVCGMALFFILFSTVWRLDQVMSGSMEDTIRTGDLILGTRYDIGEDDIERYDILFFYAPDRPNELFVKRVIGLPGETIEVLNGCVYADGAELEDPFAGSSMNSRGDGVYVVPEGCYFFLGDNRNQSNDSRFWVEKYVPLGNIVGKAKFIIFPLKNCGNLSFRSVSEKSFPSPA